MKYKILIIVAIISAMLLCALIAVGLISPGERTDKSRRLFGIAASEEVESVPQEAESIAATEEYLAETEEIDEADVSPEAPEAEEESEEATQEPEEEPEAEYREPLEKYNDLLLINPFVSGWLKIDDSAIDDPVVYTPKSQNYFLHRALDGSESEKGTFFIADNWRDGYNQTLIYGHNMRDGSGFGSLTKYAKESYWESHPVIHFDTLYEERDYDVFAAFYSQIDEDELETEEDRAAADKAIAEESLAKKADEGEDVDAADLTVSDMDLFEDVGDIDIYRQEKDEDNGRFRYYYYTDLSDKEDFDYFVENVKERALYDTGVEPEWGDELITLSTCSYQVKNGRFVLVGVRKK